MNINNMFTLKVFRIGERKGGGIWGLRVFAFISRSQRRQGEGCCRVDSQIKDSIYNLLVRSNWN